MIVTADHGNADEMIERDKKTNARLARRPPTAPTSPRRATALSPVPCFLFAPGRDDLAHRRGRREGPRPRERRRHRRSQLLGFVPPEDYARSLLK
jgi:2,3-bisphosphoglycerate-independent phosphoglycerate mutase